MKVMMTNGAGVGRQFNGLPKLDVRYVAYKLEWLLLGYRGVYTYTPFPFSPSSLRRSSSITRLLCCPHGVLFSK